MSYINCRPLNLHPLGEATQPVNTSSLNCHNIRFSHNQDSYQSLQDGTYESERPRKSSKGSQSPKILSTHQPSTSVGPNLLCPKFPPSIHNYGVRVENRISAVSETSSGTRGKLKSLIGPWKLGKTLGRGSSARVRLARHQITGQVAAVKIVPKIGAQISQSGSLANFEKAESRLHNHDDGLKHMPVGIEREVAIMKLIQHPNILKLYDIWENRKEIYLCLEYVDNGELFEQIAQNGRLKEEEAMGYFRQILSAVEYCHSFNICHRDLKPENILLTSSGQIKIADFGMAALHQAPGQQLSTSCGSPHYAAPELIRGSKYHGNMVDIWSMGVILFAALAGRLPFDAEGVSKEWLAPLLAKIKKGQYNMPANFSPEVKSLIRSMLQINPKDRITLSQIWKHPLLKKYDYLDNLGQEPYSLLPSAHVCRHLRLQRSQVSPEIFRHLWSMWHTFSEKQLMEALLNNEPNDQKLFYALLVKFRDTQLENYVPDIRYSISDYHHVNPVKLTRTLSTCHFSQPGERRHNRTISKFTVIKNNAKNEQSYTSSKDYPQRLNPDDSYKKNVHDIGLQRKKDPEITVSVRQVPRIDSQATAREKRNHHLAPATLTSRSSLISSTRSRNNAGKIRISFEKKRGVSFNHLHKSSKTNQGSISTDLQPLHKYGYQSSLSKVANNDDNKLAHVNVTKLDGASIESLSNKHCLTSHEKISATEKFSHIFENFKEDIRVHSNCLAKDCDEAFNFLQDPLLQDSKTQIKPKASSTIIKKKLSVSSLNSRPLPQPSVTQIISMRSELLHAREKAEIRRKAGGNESSSYLNQLVAHIDKLLQHLPPINSYNESPVVSVSMDLKNFTAKGFYLPISKNDPEALHPHFQRSQNHEINLNCNFNKPLGDDKQTEYLSAHPCKDDSWTAWSSTLSHRSDSDELQLSSPDRPMDIPLPLAIQKKMLISQQISSPVIEQVCNPKKSFLPNESQTERTTTAKIDPVSQRYKQAKKDVYLNDHLNKYSPFSAKRNLNWFKKDLLREAHIESNEKQPQVLRNFDNTGEHLCEGRFCIPSAGSKKPGFGLGKFFKKQHYKLDMMFCNNHGYDDLYDNTTVGDFITDVKCCSNVRKSIDYKNSRYRQVVPQRNWWARLFKVKPVIRFICFSIPKKKALLEILGLLREWRRFGIEGIQVDKSRSIIFGQVGVENYLQIKNVGFATEFMTVIEHGKRSALSIARWTQEHGAASSFHKVVDTIEKVLKERNMLVAIEQKRNMMVKTVKYLPAKKT